MPLDLALLFGRRADFVWRELHWPAELAPEMAVALLRQLGTDQFVRLIAFEVEANGGVVVHRVGVPRASVARVEQLFMALVPSSAVTPTAPRSLLPNGWRMTLTNRQRPLRVDDPERITRALLAAVTAAGRKERVVVQWLLGRTHAPRPVALSETAPVESWWRLPIAGETQLDPERRRALETKRSSTPSPASAESGSKPQRRAGRGRWRLASWPRCEQQKRRASASN